MVPKNDTGGGRETAFWILLFGSWIMLNSNAWPNQLLGAAGTAAFLALAFGSLGRFQAMGMHIADWSPVSRRYWFWSAGLGTLAGATAVAAAQLAGQRIRIADNWRVFALQVGLGPVLEEILFRGYLIRFGLWALRIEIQYAGIDRCGPVQCSPIRWGSRPPSANWLEGPCCDCRDGCRIWLHPHEDSLYGDGRTSTRFLQSRT